MRKVRLRWDFVILLSAIFFLADPMVAYCDLLPDVIGYCLLFIGLIRLSDLREGMDLCRKRLRVLIPLGMVQLCAECLVRFYLPSHLSEMNRYELPVLILLCSFFTALLRIFLFVPFLRQLFAEMERFGAATGATAILQKRCGRSLAERMCRVCTVGVVITSVCALLPECSVLTSFEASATDPLTEYEWYRTGVFASTSTSNWTDWFPYVGFFRLLTATISSVTGILWCICWIRGFGKILGDREWIRSLQDSYKQTVLSQPDLLTVRNIRSAFGWLFLGSWCLVSVKYGSYSIFFSPLFGVCGAIAIAILFSVLGKRKYALSLFLPQIVLSTFGLVLGAQYQSRYTPKDAFYSETAYWHFSNLRVLVLAVTVCSVLVWILIDRTVHAVICRHTGVCYSDNEALSEKATLRLHRELSRKRTVSTVLFLLAMIGNCAEFFLQASFSQIWIATTFLTVAAILYGYSFLKELYEQVQVFHRSDGTNSQRG